MFRKVTIDIEAEKKMKKILLISFEFPDSKHYCGGVGQVVKQSRNTLQELGHEVYVLVTREFAKKMPARLLLPDGAFVAYPNLFSLEKDYPWVEFDCIIQHFVNWTKQLKRLRQLNGRRPKIVYQFHSILRREKDAGFNTFKKYLINQERMIELADQVICPSRYEFEHFNMYFPNFSKKVMLIENTVESFPFMQEEVNQLRRLHKISDKDVVSLYVGRLERIKGADIIIDYLPRLMHRHKNLKMFIFGKSREPSLYRRLQRIKKLFPRRLFYLKYVEKQKLFQYYYLSQIYVNTSLSESFSLSTHEGALCNNALLLNRLPVFDKFRNSALFFSAQDGNGDGLVTRFSQLIDNSRFRAHLAKKALRLARHSTNKEYIRINLSQIVQNRS